MSVIPKNTEYILECWAERGEHWKSFSTEPKSRGPKPRISHKPLILSGHGISVRVDGGTLLVRNGFTHYPQKNEEFRFFPRDKRLPTRIVIISAQGSVTMEAIRWLSEQCVQLVQIDWRGEVISTIGGLGYCADIEVLRTQMEIQNTPYALSYACYLIENKIENSLSTIQKVFAPSPAAETAINKLSTKLAEIRRKQPLSVPILLGAEGFAAQMYFRCWHSSPLKWRKLSKKPIREDWHRIGSRMDSEKGNQHASHPINAMLNYGYGMLENQVRTIVLSMGFDPTIGLLHAYQRNRPTLIFDLMEPIRPLIDEKVLTFALANFFSPADFVVSNAGVCKLHPQLARVVVSLVQDISEVELTTVRNLRKLIEMKSSATKTSTKSYQQFQAKVMSRRA